MTVLELFSDTKIVVLVINIANMSADQVFGARLLPGTQIEILELEF